ncbi:uncharacterized protein LOC135092426 [Scylla paramamosain]|uniref:uncharacterized protein LOC135092426 n=1 Tax=Scylla paramamosain TaxID=85552 RepID=UPI003082BBD4
MQGDHHWRHTCQVSTAMDLHTSAPWKHELRGTSLEAPTRRDITGAAHEAVVHKHTSAFLAGRDGALVFPWCGPQWCDPQILPAARFVIFPPCKTVPGYTRQ